MIKWFPLLVSGTTDHNYQLTNILLLDGSNTSGRQRKSNTWAHPCFSFLVFFIGMQRDNEPKQCKCCITANTHSPQSEHPSYIIFTIELHVFYIQLGSLTSRHSYCRRVTITTHLGRCIGIKATFFWSFYATDIMDIEKQHQCPHSNSNKHWILNI